MLLFIQYLELKLPAIVNGGYDFVDVRDVTNGIVPIVLPIALVKIIAPICETYYNIKKEVTLFTKYSLYTLQSKSNFSHEKATKELGYTTRNLNETIEDTIKWFINSNRI